MDDSAEKQHISSNALIDDEIPDQLARYEKVLGSLHASSKWIAGLSVAS